MSNRNSYGIIWSEPTGLAILRLPHYNAKGIGSSILIEWHGPASPATGTDSPPTGAFHSIDDTVRDFYHGIVGAAKRLAPSADREKPILQNTYRKPVDSLNQLYAEESAGNKLSYINVIDGLKSGIEHYERWATRHPIEADGISIAADLVGILGNSFAFVLSSRSGQPIVAGGALIAAGGSMAALFADGADAYYRLRGDTAAYFGDRKAVVSDALATRRWEHTAFYRQAELLSPICNLLPPTREVRSSI